MRFNLVSVSQDPSPQRDHIFFVSGLEEGTQHSGVLARLEHAKLGRLRLNFRSHGTQARASCCSAAKCYGRGKGSFCLCQAYMDLCPVVYFRRKSVKRMLKRHHPTVSGYWIC